MRILSSRAMDILERGLGISALRQRVLAANIANVNTPLYKRYDVSFKELLDQAQSSVAKPLELKVTNQWHIPATADSAADPIVYQEADTAYRTDGNNVDIDYEMAQLAENSIYYQALARQLSSRLALLRTAITEGRR